MQNLVCSLYDFVKKRSRLILNYKQKTLSPKNPKQYYKLTKNQNPNTHNNNTITTTTKLNNNNANNKTFTHTNNKSKCKTETGFRILEHNKRF